MPLASQGTRPSWTAWVYCLQMDISGSTVSGLGLPTIWNDRFNEAVIQQIQPHLEGVRLLATRDAGVTAESAEIPVLMKSGGDGWLVFSEHVDALPRLCCLALIEARRFRSEISGMTGIPQERIPGLRIGMSAGRDRRVVLPDGGMDWMGDSGRRAVRVADAYRCQDCVLVDEPIRQATVRDFQFAAVDASDGIAAAKREEELVVHQLLGLNPALIDCANREPWFDYTIAVINRGDAGAA